MTHIWQQFFVVVIAVSCLQQQQQNVCHVCCSFMLIAFTSGEIIQHEQQLSVFLS